MSTSDLEKLISERLKAYGLLKVESVEHMGRRVYLARLMSLPFIVQNLITVSKQNDAFHVNSGIIFNSRDVSEEVTHSVEGIIGLVASGRGLSVKKFADGFVIAAKPESDIAKLGETISKVAKAVRELNRLFSQDTSLREECLRQKVSSMLGFE